MFRFVCQAINGNLPPFCCGDGKVQLGKIDIGAALGAEAEFGTPATVTFSLFFLKKIFLIFFKLFVSVCFFRSVNLLSMCLNLFYFKKIVDSISKMKQTPISIVLFQAQAW